jgi:hypothetical protein
MNKGKENCGCCVWVPGTLNKGIFRLGRNRSLSAHTNVNHFFETRSLNTSPLLGQACGSHASCVFRAGLHLLGATAGGRTCLKHAWLPHQSPSPSLGVWPQRSVFFPVHHSWFMSAFATGVSTRRKALKRLQSHFETSWQKIECHPETSLGFKHRCQSRLSPPRDFLPRR